LKRFAAVVASMATAVASASSGRQQTFRGGVHVVLVDASVVRDRAPLAGLRADDFVVTDNGVRQRIEAIDTASIPLDVSLVVDVTWFTSGVVGPADGPAGTDILRRNAQQIAELLRPDDRLGVITYAEAVVETRPMSPIGDGPVRVFSANPTSKALTYGARVGQALLTALTAPVSADRRHFVVIFAGAKDVLDVPDPAYLTRVASRADALLYVVLNPPGQFYDTHQPLRLFPSEELVRKTLTRAAEATGGRAYLTGDIVGAFRDAVKAFRSGYVLRYTLDGVPSAGWHDIVVRVRSCPDCTIRARRGYVGQ
jgi:VWFA-related protein